MPVAFHISMNWGVLLIKHSQSANGMDGIQRWSQSSFVFFPSGAGSRPSLSVKFYGRKSLVLSGDRASIIPQVIVCTTKGILCQRSLTRFIRWVRGSFNWSEIMVPMIDMESNEVRLG